MLSRQSTRLGLPEVHLGTLDASETERRVLLNSSAGLDGLIFSGRIHHHGNRLSNDGIGLELSR